MKAETSIAIVMQARNPTNCAILHSSMGRCAAPKAPRAAEARRSLARRIPHNSLMYVRFYRFRAILGAWMSRLQNSLQRRSSTSSITRPLNGAQAVRGVGLSAEPWPLDWARGSRTIGRHAYRSPRLNWICSRPISARSSMSCCARQTDLLNGGPA